MNPEIKELWTDTLRSGEFLQGKGRLHGIGDGPNGEDSFCCLGVLCELAIRSGLDISVVIKTNGSVSYDTYDGLLPTSVVMWAGLEDRDPDTGDAALSSINDDGSTFSEIADLIDEHL